MENDKNGLSVTPTWWTQLFDPKEGRPLRDIPHTGTCKKCGKWDGHRLDCPEVTMEQLAKIVIWSQKKEEQSKERAKRYWEQLQRAIGKVAVLRHENNKLRKAADTRNRNLPNATKQTTPTNCFQACVATVLGVPITDVTTACDGSTWNWDIFQDWLADRGLQAIEIGFGNGGTIYPVRRPVLCIVTGESPRECVTGRHAVVGELLGLEGFRLLHDPHPSEMWIDGEPTHAVFFVPIN